jgi:hypothetical protein
MELVAFGLAIHGMTEWNSLAKLLPRLYAEFGVGEPDASVQSNR